MSKSKILVALLAIIIGGTAPGKATPAAAASTECMSPALGALAIGFTLTHVKIQPETDLACGGGVIKGTPVEGGDNIVLNYQNSAVAGRVRELLAQMSAQGATAIRTILWYYHAEDIAEAQRVAKANPLGMPAATQGKLESSVVQNLVAYISDAQRTGFRRFYVVVSPQGKSNSKCKGAGDWGSCYDESLDGLSWSVTKQVVETLKSVPPGIHTYVDIASEDCWMPDSGRLVDRTAEHFVRFMTTRYRDSFGDQKFFVSCGAGKGDVRRPLGGLHELVSLYRELGVRPAVVDIHNYAIDSDKAQQITAAAGEAAQQLGVPLVIGETYFDHPTIFGIIARLENENSLPSLRDILIWPGRRDSKCHPNLTMQPPFDMSIIDQALGRRDEKRKKRRRCENQILRQA